MLMPNGMRRSNARVAFSRSSKGTRSIPFSALARATSRATSSFSTESTKMPSRPTTALLFLHPVGSTRETRSVGTPPGIARSLFAGSTTRKTRGRTRRPAMRHPTRARRTLGVAMARATSAMTRGLLPPRTEAIMMRVHLLPSRTPARLLRTPRRRRPRRAGAKTSECSTSSRMPRPCSRKRPSTTRSRRAEWWTSEALCLGRVRRRRSRCPGRCTRAGLASAGPSAARSRHGRCRRRGPPADERHERGRHARRRSYRSHAGLRRARAACVATRTASPSTA